MLYGTTKVIFAIIAVIFVLGLSSCSKKEEPYPTPEATAPLPEIPNQLYEVFNRKAVDANRIGED